MPLKTNDSFSHEGANNLAKDIREYWRDRGHRVKVWLEELLLNAGQKDQVTLYVVRSNLLNGKPRPAE